MAGLITEIAQKYNYVIHDLADPRTIDWFGVSNPFFVLSLLSAYLTFCKVIGPNVMEARKPLELKTVVMMYNLCQVIFSIFLVYEGAAYIFHKDSNIACEPVDYSDNPRALRAAAGTWYYYIAKITELLDTVFFVLRKKYNQVSFLHVFHHTIMPLHVWFGVKYIPGGHMIFMGFLNSIVHIIMYTYYLVSGLGPQYQKYLWWKKHVTIIQLIQFCIVFVHNFSVFFYPCDYPRILNGLACLYAMTFMYMFGSFYLDSYMKDSNEKKKKGTIKTPSFAAKVQEFGEHQKLKEKSV